MVTTDPTLIVNRIVGHRRPCCGAASVGNHRGWLRPASLRSARRGGFRGWGRGCGAGQFGSASAFGVGDAADVLAGEAGGAAHRRLADSQVEGVNDQCVAFGSAAVGAGVVGAGFGGCAGESLEVIHSVIISQGGGTCNVPLATATYRWHDGYHG